MIVAGARWTVTARPRTAVMMMTSITMPISMTEMIERLDQVAPLHLAVDQKTDHQGADDDSASASVAVKKLKRKPTSRKMGKISAQKH